MFITRIINNFKKYTFLMFQMISRDFKVKYKRSVLGVLWSLLYPLMMTGIMALVFSQMFKFRMEGVNYLVYLMTGLVMFNYFSEATSSGMTSVVTNFNLINKIYIPKYIFPLSKCLFVGINFLLSLIPLLLIVLITGAPIKWTYIALPYVFLCLFLFAVGISFITSAISVFLRDMFYIYGILLTIWQYLTPIFYDIRMLPTYLQVLFKFNPLYQYINFARAIFLEGKMPNGYSFLWCGMSALLFFVIGCLVFKLKQDRFIYYV